MKTHEKVRERFVCKLDNCNKSYTQKGNLKVCSSSLQTTLAGNVV